MSGNGDISIVTGKYHTKGFAKKQPDEFVPSGFVDGLFKEKKNCAVLYVVCILKFFVLILLVP